MSWRDGTPEAVQDDLDLLADESLSAAGSSRRWRASAASGAETPVLAAPTRRFPDASPDTDDRCD
jgi:hypothetical protein